MMTGSNYGKLPCHYYLDAMRMEGRKTFVMSNPGRPNPCVALLVEAGAVYVTTQTYLQDFACLVHAKRLVASRSTFPIAAMLLSKPKDAFYALVSSKTILRYQFERFGPCRKCRTTDAYEEEVIKTWTANERQLHFMQTTHNGCVWE
jgi:hypothetical protein